VIGGSAGSIEALRDLVPQLPPDLPLAVFVVVHISPTSHSRLPEILGRAGRLHVRHAIHGDRVEPGRVLVAPPDQHLLVLADRVQLSRGPRENSTRPAADPLFRSATAAFGSRVCGVVLSGHLDDGSEGLRLIAAAGGLCLVQDPAEAIHPDMPRNALLRVPHAEVHTAMRLGRRITGLGRAPSAGRGASPPPAAGPPSTPMPSVPDTQITFSKMAGRTRSETAERHAGVLERPPFEREGHEGEELPFSPSAP